MRARSRRRPALVAAAALGLAAVLAWSEWATWRASWQGLDVERLDPWRREPGEAVLVLGFRSSANGRINLVQRWRTRIAVRSVDPATARFVFSGAATRGAVSEAALMADYAVHEFGVPRGHVVLEEQARTTWENVENSIPLLRAAPTIKIASTAFHARRARRYLAEQAPELAVRLQRARDFRFGELALVKPLLGVYEWRRKRLGLDG